MARATINQLQALQRSRKTRDAACWEFSKLFERTFRQGDVVQYCLRKHVLSGVVLYVSPYGEPSLKIRAVESGREYWIKHYDILRAYPSLDEGVL